MWPFKALYGAKQLRDELEELKSDFRRLRIEWEEVLESLERRAASLRARERHERAKVPPEEPLASGEPANGSETPSGRLLTPRQQQIQQQILRRRSGMQ